MLSDDRPIGDERPCPFCKGAGVVTHEPDLGALGRGMVKLSCDACSGTGDRHLMELVRAFRLGQAHEHAVIMSRVTGAVAPAQPGAETIRRAVLDDATRQRYEEALDVARGV